jgi:hypothetical protein
VFNPLNAELNPICHFLALLGAHHILHVSRIRVNVCCVGSGHCKGLVSSSKKSPCVCVCMCVCMCVCASLCVIQKPQKGRPNPSLVCAMEKRVFEDFVQRWNMKALLRFISAPAKSQNFIPSKYCVAAILTNNISYLLTYLLTYSMEQSSS